MKPFTKDPGFVFISNFFELYILTTNNFVHTTTYHLPSVITFLPNYDENVAINELRLLLSGQRLFVEAKQLHDINSSHNGFAFLFKTHRCHPFCL